MDPQEPTAREEGKKYMVIWRKHSARSLVVPGKALALASLCPPFSPMRLLQLESKKAGRKDRGRNVGSRQRANPTSRLHQIQRNRLPSRYTPQQSDVTGWWPRRCPRHPASLVPVAPPPSEAGSLGGWQKAGHCVHHSQQARRTWAWWHQKEASVVQQAGHQHH